MHVFFFLLSLAQLACLMLLKRARTLCNHRTLNNEI
jgi:hypothetical protein